MGRAIIDYFTAAELRRVGERFRTWSPEATQEFALARQRLEAGDLLAHQGQWAEAMRLVSEAYKAAWAVASALASTDAQAETTLAVWTALGASARATEQQASLLQRLEAPGPLLDDDITDAHRTLLSDLQTATSVSLRLLERAVPFRRRVLGARLRRGFAALAVLCAGGAVGRYLTTPPPPYTVEVSATGTDGHSQKENAVDGNPRTAWQLPDGAAGWIDVLFPEPRPIRTLTLVNGINAPWNDRATRDYTVEVRLDDNVVKNLPGRLEYDLNPRPISLEIRVPRADAIRIRIRSHHRAGGGIGEIRWQ